MSSELREQIIAAGADLVSERARDGLRLSDLSLAKACERAGIDLEQAISEIDDDTYHREVALEMVRRTYPAAGTYAEETMAVGQALLARHADRLYSMEGRRWLFIELCRRTLSTNQASVTDSGWYGHIALASLFVAMGSDDNGQRSVQRKALTNSMRVPEGEFVEFMSSFYQVVSSILGLDPRLPHEQPYAVAAVMGRAIADGFALSELFSDNVADMAFVGDPFNVGTADEWSLPALAFTSVALTIFEPHPRFDPEAALRRVQIFGAGEG